MKFFCLFLLILFLTVTGAAFSLSPPMAKTELTEKSNAIVSASVNSVECTGKRSKAPCGELVQYKTTLTVQQVLKGKKAVQSAKQIHLYFEIIPKPIEGCVGDSEATHLPGEVGIYYLDCKGTDCGQIHWSGFEAKKEGKGQLPVCF